MNAGDKLRAGETQDATRALARFIANAVWHDVPQPVRHEGARAILNWLGCALGGCHDETVERLSSTLGEFAGKPQATLIGRGDKTDILTAACINAVSANILDFDDTHLRTVIHATVPVASALLALAEYRALSGAEFLHAFILGFETACRIGNAIAPEHYEKGWHSSATCGVFGAAAAAGKALRLDEQHMSWALGIAATQSSGLREMLGSMCKSYNLGHAARSGLEAALLAASEFTSSNHALEAARGFFAVLADRSDGAELTRGLGNGWEISHNALKPYPCGVVIHPVIDACLDLRAIHAFDAAQIAHIEVTLNPLAMQVCGNPDPCDGLASKLSVHHSAAAALLFGKAGVTEYSDRCTADLGVAALRARVALTPDASLGRSQARVCVRLASGLRHESFTEHARGSLERPYSDADLDAKFRTLAAALAPDAIEMLLAKCRALADMPDAGTIARDSAIRVS